MSDAVAAAQEGVARAQATAEVQSSVQEKIRARLEAESGGDPDPDAAPTDGVEGADGVQGDPTVESVDGVDDDPLQDELDDDESDDMEEEDDLDDDDTDEDDADDATWEQRYKDQQALVQESRESVKAAEEEVQGMRKVQTERLENITRTRFELEDRLGESEKVANYFAQKATAQLQRARSINLSQVPQEQYQQAQAYVQNAEAEFQAAQRDLRNAVDMSKRAREEAIGRQAALTRDILAPEFPEFLEKTYPALAKFADENGVSQQAFSEITDPGLIRMMNKLMTLTAEPDTVTTLKKKPKAKRHRSRNLPGKQTGSKARERKADKALHSATSRDGRQAAFLEKKRAQLDRENRR